MKQFINLYEKYDLKYETGFSFLHVVQVMGLFLGMVAVITVWILYQYVSVQSDVSRLTRENVQLVSQLKLVNGEIPTDAQKVSAANRIKALEQLKTQNKLMLETLGRVKRDEMIHFSRYLRAFAEHVSGDIAVQRVHISKEGSEVIIQGEALDAECVPRFIQRLGGSPIFSGRAFEKFLIETQEGEKYINFTLESR